VVKVFKSHTQDFYWQSLWQFTAVLGVELKAMFRQLGLSILARTSKFIIHGSFHNHSGSFLISGLRNFEVHVAVRGRRIPLDEHEVRSLAEMLRSFGRSLTGNLPKP